MTELEKIEYAKSFIDKLANGMNPLDNTPIPENDIANHARLSKCFAYVGDVLGQIVENGKYREKRAKRGKRTYFDIAPEQLKNFEYSQEPITTSEFCRRLEALVDLSKVKHISRTSLPSWLFHMGFLVPRKDERYSKGAPTEKGLKIGLVQKIYTCEKGTYINYLLGLDAQKFIIDNIESFLAFRARSKLKLKSESR